MARLDAPYGALKAKLADTSLSREQQADVKAKMTEREQLLLPVYAQVSLQFADLHDRAGRMQAKGTIRAALRWREARRFFYWRLRRRLNEEYILRRMASAESKETAPSDAIVAREKRLAALKAWSGVEKFDKEDMKVALWYEENRKDVHARVEMVKKEGIAADVAGLMRRDIDAGLRGFKQMLDMLPVDEREEALKMLSKA